MDTEEKMLAKLTRKDFDKMFALMEKSFPVDELRTYEDEKALLDIPEYDVYYLPEADGGVLGFITAWKFKAFSYLDHFAVNPDRRNGGIGAGILNETVKTLGGLVCLEVELPETEIAKRRIAFYTRNGFYLNDFPYVQPPISKGRQPVPLQLMTTGGRISDGDFGAIKSELYRNVYKVPETETFFDAIAKKKD